MYLLHVDGVPYLLRVNAEGIQMSQRLQELVVLDQGPVPDPGDPVPPSGFQERVTAWARSLEDPVIASAVGQSFLVLADKIESGELSGTAEISDTTKRVLDVIIRQSTKQSGWVSLRARLADELAARAAAGSLATKAQYASAYREIGRGLQAAAPGTAAINLEVIVKLVLAILSKDPGAIVEAVLALVEALSNR